MKMLTYHLVIFFFFVLFQITELTTGNVKAKMEVDSTCKYVFHWLDYKEKKIYFFPVCPKVTIGLHHRCFNV